MAAGRGDSRRRVHDGDRRRELAHLPALRDAGYAVASVEYRFSGEALFPAAVLDVKQATAYLRAHAAELNLNPVLLRRLGTLGRRAPVRDARRDQRAGHGIRRPWEVRGAVDFGDSSVQAVVDWYGPLDFLVMDAQFITGPPTGNAPPVQSHDDPGSPESRWLAAPSRSCPRSPPARTPSPT